MDWYQDNRAVLEHLDGDDVVNAPHHLDRPVVRALDAWARQCTDHGPDVVHAVDLLRQREALAFCAAEYPSADFTAWMHGLWAPDLAPALVLVAALRHSEVLRAALALSPGDPSRTTAALVETGVDPITWVKSVLEECDMFLTPLIRLFVKEVGERRRDLLRVESLDSTFPHSATLVGYALAYGTWARGRTDPARAGRSGAAPV
jgi:hypothetical protein